MTQESILATLYEVLDRRGTADESLHAQAVRSIRDLIQADHSFAPELIRLAKDGAYASQVEVVNAVEAAFELQAVKDFVAECLLSPNEDLAIAAANSAGNIAGTDEALAAKVLDVVKQSGAKTSPRLYEARVSALRNVHPSAEVIETLTAVTTGGPIQAQRAAVSSLATLVRRAPRANPSPEIDVISQSSEIVGRTSSISIRVASIDVVAGVCLQILDEEREDEWVRATAHSVLGLLGPLRIWGDQ